MPERIEPITIHAAIAGEIYLAIEKLGGSPELLSIIGSYGDTLDDQDVLDALRLYNETGKALIEKGDRH